MSITLRTFTFDQRRNCFPIIQNLRAVITSIQKAEQGTNHNAGTAQRIKYDDDHIKLKDSGMSSLTKKEATRQRILETAAKIIRRAGFDALGVADVISNQA